MSHAMKFFLVAATLLFATLLFVAAQPQRGKDFYSILGVSRSATEKDIKARYKKLARELHPDRAHDGKREEIRKRFIAVTEAYEILGDAEKRKSFDETGWGMHGNEDRQYLKHHLFSENYEGHEYREMDMKKLMAGENQSPTLVFFWSPNFPDCIDAAKPYKELATKLKGTSIILASFKCEDAIIFCRDLYIGAPPKIVAFPPKSNPANRKRYTDRYNLQSLMHFAAEFFSAGEKVRFPTVGADLWFDRCPNPENDPSLKEEWVAEYFSEMRKNQCKLAAVNHDFVAFSSAPCYDCSNELRFAAETWVDTIPDVKLAKADCESPEGNKLCKALHKSNKQATSVGTPLVVENKAWTIARIARRCWYSPMEPFSSKYTDYRCDDVDFTKYEGKYDAKLFNNFVLGPVVKSLSALSIFNPRDLKMIRESDDGYAVVYINRRTGLTDDLAMTLSLLSLYTTRTKPTGKKGQQLHFGLVECSLNPAGACDDVKGHAFPMLAIYPFTSKAKKRSGSPKLQATFGGGGFMQMLRDALKEAEPLRIHQLTGENFNKLKEKAMKKKKRLFVLFGAGEWCPPCVQMKSMWPEMARMLQEAPEGKKIVIAQVDCDKERNLCRQVGIEGFPSMWYYAPDRPEPTKYGGDREIVAMKNFAIEQLESRVVSLSPQDIMYKVQGGGTLLVCFNAGQWCPPCQMIKPMFKKASSLMGNVEATMVDCDELQQFCSMFQIDGYPTIMLFHKGTRLPFNAGIGGSASQLGTWVKEKTGQSGKGL